jgi:hypothetical protein
MFVPSPRGFEISNAAQIFPKKQLWWTRYPIHKNPNPF